jgi:hypothetical protein
VVLNCLTTGALAVCDRSCALGTPVRGGVRRVRTPPSFPRRDCGAEKQHRFPKFPGVRPEPVLANHHFLNEKTEENDCYFPRQGLVAVTASGKEPVGLGALRAFALAEGRLGARSLPAVLVWAMPRELGLPAGPTGKPVRIGLAAKLGLHSCSSEEDVEEKETVCDCWIGRRRQPARQGSNGAGDVGADVDGAGDVSAAAGVEWELERWATDQSQQPDGLEGQAALGSGEGGGEGGGGASLEQVVSAARAALYSDHSSKTATLHVAGAAAAAGAAAPPPPPPPPPPAAPVVVEAVRRLAVAAIGLDPHSAASADIITPDSVLMDRGLDSMSAAGCAKRHLFAPFHARNALFYQDRLGTNIGQQNRRFSHQVCGRSLCCAVPKKRKRHVKICRLFFLPPFLSKNYDQMQSFGNASSGQA